MNTDLNQVLVVPQKSTFEVQEKLNVFVVDGQNRVHIKSFTPGQRFADQYVVSEGLSSADRIVFEGVQLLKEGQLIVPEFISARKSLTHLSN